MTDRLQRFSREALGRIHDASMDILARTGICFNSEKAVRLFKGHGLKTDGNKVFFTENSIVSALETIPPRFTVKARNPDKDLIVGEDHYIFLSTGGAPNIAMPSGGIRPAVMADFQTCCKLVQTSDQVDMGASLMVQPNDIPSETAHLDMLETYISLCDKPIFGASHKAEAALDSIRMAAMVWGREETIPDAPVLLTNTNAMSPLQYAQDQSEVIMEMARWCQPVVISTMVLAGSTGPVSLPGLLVLQNAEILAGMVLAQLVNPGTPVVYGSTSVPMDMMHMTSATGAPETSRIASATAQIARYYNVPCRAGGMLTDAHCTDAQALAESTLLLSTAVRDGAHFIFHATGQMGSYLSMGFEKWIIDEEVCAMVRSLFTPMDITVETVDLETIRLVGQGGEYLTHPKTFGQFKDLFQPGLFNRKPHEKWLAAGGETIIDTAGKTLEQRLESYQAPPIDAGVQNAIQEYVTLKKTSKNIN